MLQSGVTFHEAQVALAKVYIGSDDLMGNTDEVVNIEKPHDQTTGVDQIGKKDTVEKAVPLPKTVDEVGQTLFNGKIVPGLGGREQQILMRW